MPPEPDPSALPRPPIRPHPRECCNSGCVPCIYDYYDRALTHWEQAIAARGLDPKAVRAAFTAAAGDAERQ